MIYLDCAASLPMRSEVKSALIEYFDIFGNPSAVHRAGVLARRKINEARRVVADYFRVTPESVIFTSGATESNSMVIHSMSGNRIFSMAEHSSIRAGDTSLLSIPVKKTGAIDTDSLDKLFKEQRSQCGEICLLSLSVVNGETGVLQPMDQILEVCQRHDVLLHADASQCMGKANLGDFAWDSCAFITCSSHKIGGPKGAGALIMNKAISEKGWLSPFLKGGGQEHGYRSGTENTLAYIGFGEAVFCLLQNEEQEHQYLSHLKSVLREQLGAYFTPYLDPVSSFTFLTGTQEAFTALIHLDHHGVCASAGSACSSGTMHYNNSLFIVGLPDDVVQKTLRISYGYCTTVQEIEEFAKIYKQSI